MPPKASSMRSGADAPQPSVALLGGIDFGAIARIAAASRSAVDAKNRGEKRSYGAVTGTKRPSEASRALMPPVEPIDIHTFRPVVSFTSFGAMASAMPRSTSLFRTRHSASPEAAPTQDALSGPPPAAATTEAGSVPAPAPVATLVATNAAPAINVLQPRKKKIVPTLAAPANQAAPATVPTHAHHQQSAADAMTAAAAATAAVAHAATATAVITLTAKPKIKKVIAPTLVSGGAGATSTVSVVPRHTPPALGPGGAVLTTTFADKVAALHARHAHEAARDGYAPQPPPPPRQPQLPPGENPWVTRAPQLCAPLSSWFPSQPIRTVP
jgi:hypothetical protein